MTDDLTRSQPNIREFFSSTKDAAAKVEIKFCSFIAEHNLPISLCEDLVALLRNLFPSDAALKNVTLGKQKATNTIRQVLGFYYMMEGIDNLQSHKFSLIVDETTDRSTVSQLAILGSYFDAERLNMKFVFIDIVKMPDGKADTIYGKIIECFQERNIPMANVIGFWADTCNVMFGKNHSVSQMLVRDYQWILPVKCSCHMIHLCASHSSMKLQKSLEDLCRNVYSHFSLSSQRCEAFSEFQDFLNLNKHRILKPGQTRWLSMKACVDRILEQYAALKL